MNLLELGAAALAVTALLVLGGYLLRAFRWAHRTARRLEEVLERTDQMPQVIETVRQLQGEVAGLTGRLGGLTQQLAAATTNQADVTGRHGGLLGRLKQDVDTLWCRHRALAAEVALVKEPAR
jgi:HAMP domain-containing protein